MATQFLWLGAILLPTTLALLVWLVFVICRREKWIAFVDKDNDFWVRKGIFSETFAEKFRRIEKGIALKLLLGCGVLLGVFGIVVIGIYWRKACALQVREEVSAVVNEISNKPAGIARGDEFVRRLRAIQLQFVPADIHAALQNFAASIEAANEARKAGLDPTDFDRKIREQSERLKTTLAKYE